MEENTITAVFQIIAVVSLGLALFFTVLYTLADVVRGIDNARDAHLYGPFDRPEDRR